VLFSTIFVPAGLVFAVPLCLVFRHERADGSLLQAPEVQLEDPLAHLLLGGVALGAQGERASSAAAMTHIGSWCRTTAWPKPLRNFAPTKARS